MTKLKGGTKMEFKEVLDYVWIIFNRMRGTIGNEILFVYQIKEMMLIAHEEQKYSNPNCFAFESKEVFNTTHGLNKYVIYFSKETRELYEKLLQINDMASAYKEFCSFSTDITGKRGANNSSTICDLAAAMSKDLDYESVIDICAGDGTFLAEMKDEKIKNRKGYEINSDQVHFANGYLKMCGLDGCVENTDVLSVEAKEKYDVVLAEFPLKMKVDGLGYEKFESENIKPEKGQKLDGNWSFIYKALNFMSDRGRVYALVNDGSLYTIPEEGIRKSIVDGKLLEAVIKLPTGIIPSTSVTASLLVFSRNNDYVTLIDASDKFESASKREKRVRFDEIVSLWDSRNDSCLNDHIKVVNIKEIAGNDYYLEVKRYFNNDGRVVLKNSKPLKDYADLVPGFQYTSKNYIEKEHGEENVHVVKVSNIIDNEINYESTASIDIDLKKAERFILKNKDILVATKGTAVKAAMFEGKGGETYIAQSNVTVIRVKNYGLSPDYLLAYINGKTGRKLLENLQKGIAISSISMKDLEGYEVPVVDEVLQYDLGLKYKDLKEEKKKLFERIASIDEEISSVCEDYIKE